MNDPFDRIPITLTRFEWEALARGLRADVNLQPRLGRLAWMVVGVIEGALADGPVSISREQEPARRSSCLK